MATTTTTTTKGEAMNTTTHTTTVTPAEGTNPTAWDGAGTYVLECTCGERVRYAGRAFTQVEAQRHAAYHARAGK